MRRAMTVGELRAALASMPDDAPVFVMAEGEMGSIVEGLSEATYQEEHERAPRGVWLPRVILDGNGDSGMDMWRERAS
jgi:hypothetical protein